MASEQQQQQQQAPSPLAGVQPEGAKLLWHVCHQCNIVTSQLNAYLSLETLQRETLASGLIVPVPHFHQLTAQAVMLTDAAKNLDAAAGLLARTPLDKPYNRGSAYQSLFDAVRLLVVSARKSIFLMPLSVEVAEELTPCSSGEARRFEH